MSEAAVGEAASFVNVAAINPSEAERTLVFGYGAIFERYLNKVSVAQVALEGMRGFATIEPSFDIRRDGDSLVALNGAATVGRYATPGDNDTVGWANLTLAVAADARRHSEAMHGADDDRLLEAVFDATLTKLDPFSRYASPSQARNQRASRNGFAGIGVRYDKIGGEGIEILSVIPESPAEGVGIVAGDMLTHIDGRPVSAMTLEAVSESLRGDIGSHIVLTVKRKASGAGEALSLRRNLVTPPTVSMVLEEGVANIKISGFNQKTAASLAKHLREARATLGDRLKGVLLDLRGNPGGLLDQAVSMADMFMSQGRIVSTRGRHRHASQTYDANPGDLAEDLPLVLLVDGKSASASEILAAALQDSGRAVVIGTNSYGKGTVQTVIRMPNDGEMTLTWSRFHSPTGYALHGLGVLPTICTAEGQEGAGDLLKTIASKSVAANLAAWRASDIEQTDLRNRLRATCPSAKHGDDPTESRLAEDLLRDKQLYAQILAMSVPTTRHAGAPAAAQPSATAQAKAH